MNTIIDFDKIFQDSKYPSDLFEKYFNYQNKFLSTEIAEMEQEMNEIVKNKSIEEQVSLTNSYYEYYIDFINGTFPDIQNKASLIILYNIFESNLKTLCNLLGKALNTPIDYSELSGDDIMKCKKFLIKFCGLNDRIFEIDSWRKIDCVRRIRNSIVHNGSNISSVLKKEKKIIAEFMLIDGFIVIDIHLGLLKSDFLKLFIIIINDFYNELIIELKRIHEYELKN